jgi:hypothetical protein
MRNQIRECVLTLAIGAVALVWGSAATAATLVNDTFTGDIIDSAPANYTTGGVAGGITLTTIDDSSSLSAGGGNALSAAATASTTYAARTFAGTTLNVGDSINVTFDTRIALPATPNVGDRIFRFGLYNSAAANTGYTGRLDTGTAAPNTFDVFRSNGIFNTTTAAPSSSASLVSGTSTDAALDDNLVRHVSLTLTRDGTGIIANLTVQEGANAPVSIANATANAAPNSNYYTLDQFVVGFNGTAGGPGQGGASAETFNLDNLVINYTPAIAPEPGSLAALATAALLVRRRR